MDDVTVERVLRLVEAVPPGHVVSYGDVADALGLSPRAVGRVMSLWGTDVPWWRVTSHSGDVTAPLRAEAFAHWREEGIDVKPNGLGCRIAAYRWVIDAAALARAEAVADLADTSSKEPPC